MPTLDSLTPELFTTILSQIPLQRDLNSLSRTSQTLYHRTIPALYYKWSYHGHAQDVKALRMFLETVNWRPDLGELVREVDLREWGDCPRCEDFLGMFWENNDEKEADVERKKKEALIGTVGEDGLFGGSDDEDDEVEDETWVESEESDEEEDDNSTDEEIDMDTEMEVDPVTYFSHSQCEKGNCKFSVSEAYKEAGKGFEKDSMVYEYSIIKFDEKEEKLIAMLFSKLPNIKTLWMVMPEVSLEWEYEGDEFCQLMENAAALNVLQKLETFYVCSSMHLGGKDHREYQLEFRRLFPFLRLPNLRSLYTLTAYAWDSEPDIDYARMEEISNVTTLAYDESELSTDEVIKSLSFFKALKSFRWTTAPSCFNTPFLGCQKILGDALEAHKNSLEEIYVDSRHPESWDHFATRKLQQEVLLGSFKSHPRLRSLAIDVNSLCGHQKMEANGRPLLDILPPSLESLTLFVKIHQTANTDDSGVVTTFDNELWYPSFLHTIQNSTIQLPQLRKISVSLTRDPQRWGQEVYVEPSLDFVGDQVFKEALSRCKDAQIGFSVELATMVDIDSVRDAGLTTMPHFLEQIRSRNPGRDF